MIEYFGKFIAAFLGLLFASIAVALAGAAIIAVISGWYWVLGFFPLWGKWVVSGIFVMVIIAAITAALDDESRW